MPSYQNLFKGQTYKTVDPARSVLSPAAYFIDLMKLVETSIEIGSSSGNTLKERRPDLWNKVILSKNNTGTEISKLEIVNEILQCCLDGNKSSSTGKTPAGEIHSQPLIKIRHCLAQNKTSLSKIWKELIPANARTSDQAKAIHLEVLGISPGQWKQICSEKPNDGFYLSRGLAKPVEKQQQEIPVEIFLKKTGLNYDQTLALIDQNLSAHEKDKEQQKFFFINSGGGPVSIEDQNIFGLTNTNMTKIQRFVRLSQMIGWSFIDLDWALRTIGTLTKNKEVAISDDALPYLAWIQDRVRNGKLSVNQCCAMIGTLKDFGQADDQPTFFDRVIRNPSNPKLPDSSEPEANLDWTVPRPGHAPQNGKDQKIQNALAAALQVNHEELLAIANYVLESQISVNNPDIQKSDERMLQCSPKSLAILYRLSLLPKLTGLSIRESLIAAELFSRSHQLALAAQPGHQVLDDMIAFSDFAKWLQKSPFSLYQLQFVLTGTSDDTTVQNKIFGKDAITSFLNNLIRSLESTLLTEKAFFNAVKTDLQHVVSECGSDWKSSKLATKNNGNESRSSTYTQLLSAAIYNSLKHSKSNSSQLSYISENFVILFEDVDKNSLVNILITIVPTFFKTLPHNKKLGLSISKLARTIAATLKSSYQLQQITFVKHLSSLYQVSSQMGATLKEIGDLHIDTMVSNEQNAHVLMAILHNMASNPTQVDFETAMPVLRKLQQAAELINTLSLSPAEVIYFKQAITLPPKLDTIQTMLQFRKLVGKFHDPQNNFLGALGSNYPSDASVQYPHAHKKQDTKSAKSLAFWFKIPTSTTPLTILPGLKVQAGKGLFNGDRNDLVPGSMINADTWHHLAITPDSVFLDGIEVFLSALYAATKNGVQVLAAGESEWKLSGFTYQYCAHFGVFNNKLYTKTVYHGVQVLAAGASEWELSGLAHQSVKGFCVFNNNLYAATDQGVQVLAARASEWKPAGLADKSVRSLCVFKNNLYASTESNGVQVLAAEASEWKPAGLRGIYKKVVCFCVFNNNLYASTVYRGVQVLAAGESEWKPAGLGGEDNYVLSFFVFNNKLYAVMNRHKAQVLAAGESEWKPAGLEVLRFCVFNNNLYAATRNGVQVLVAGESEWKLSGLGGVDLYVLCFCVFNNSLYAATNHGVQVLAAGESEWKPADLKPIGSPDLTVNDFVEFVSPLNKVKIHPFDIATAYSNSTQDVCYFSDKLTPAQISLLYDSERELVTQFGENDKSDVQSQGKEKLQNLAKLSGWKQNLLDDLINKFVTAGWQPTQSPSIASVALLEKYFNTATLLRINVHTLWQLVQFSVSTSKERDEQDISGALWGGLQAQYKDQPDVLNAIQSRLNEILRDQLVPVAMHKLGKANPRELYEHLLIDVEVSGSVKTSRVKEAISAVHLYIYRCLNQLESGVSVSPKLASLWTWMHSYRGWQANKQVFLYPEDYIQPELRKNKTALFAKAQADLKQADLTDPDSVETIFRNYMNGFVEIANLDIVGSAARDFEVDGIAAQELCMIGMTRHQPHHYYMRLATFILSESNEPQYEPSDWGEWDKFNIQINPVKYGPKTDDVGAVNPIFACGKWYVFWVEQKQTGKKNTISNSGGTATTTSTKSYTVTINYSHLDFSRRWVAPQELVSIPYPDLQSPRNPENKGVSSIQPPITDKAGSSIYPVYSEINQAILVYYDKKMYRLGGTDVTHKLKEVPEGKTPTCVGILNGGWYVGTSNSGVWLLYNNNWLQLSTENGGIPKDAFITAIIQIKHDCYIETKRSLYLYKKRRWKKINKKELNAKSKYKSLQLFWVGLHEIPYLNNFITENQLGIHIESSSNSVASDFDKIFGTNTANSKNDIVLQMVHGRPNWYILNNSGAEYLAVGYGADDAPKLNFYRLNSTAVHHLETLLHQPAGINALLSVPAQESTEKPFEALWSAGAYSLKSDRPSDQINFTVKSAMSSYYWELFFHLPFLIAAELNTHQQFAHAKKWFEYIFNPTTQKGNFWRFLGLRSSDNPVLEQELSETALQQEWSDLSNAFQLFESESDPFDPHEIASLRPIAYQKTIVTHYIKNLLDWGDRLYRQNTRESIVEAEMFYVAAYDLLGQEPRNLGPAQLAESAVYDQVSKGAWASQPYFGIPRNQQFLAYWDEVQNRLHNIRHGLTIDGKKDILPLFQPPINPMALVAAVGSGESVEQATGSINATIPYYRFSVMIEKAYAATETVIQLGQSLLSALEKKDAAKLAQLYVTNEQNILHLTRTNMQDQVTAAGHRVTALEKNLEAANGRLKHYSDLIESGLLPGEKAQVALAASAIAVQDGAEAIKTAAVIGYSLPVIYGFSDGGMKPGDAINQGANIVEGLGNIANLSSGLAGTVSSYQRRTQDWEFQKEIASNDIDEISYHVLTAKYQKNLVKKEIVVLEKRIENESKVAEFNLKKFSSEQLYQWYVGQVSALYFQAYQLALEISQQAENAWRFEHIGLATSGTVANDIIQPGYWNNLKEGLLAGESLKLDLHRLEKSHFDQNERRLEIEKTISLAQLDPKALGDLKTKGHCVFDLTEKDFDLDFPGHYARQIKTLSISLPVILGPYQNIHATLTQLSNKIVISDDREGQEAVDFLLNPSKGTTSSALKSDVRPNQQVALSHGVNDAGLFELNFNDERYLPFEGTGAISSWELEMPLEDNHNIDFKTLTDVIIQVRYIALAGNSDFKTYVKHARDDSPVKSGE